MIVVIGAGLIGLAIAHELAKRGADVRVMDEREPAGAASWAGAGMLAPFTESLGAGPFEALCARSLAAYPAFAAEIMAATGVDPRLRLDGIVEAAFDDATSRRLDRHVATLQANGIAARRLDRAQARALEPALGPGVRDAALSETEGSVDNRRLGRGLRAACVHLGARVVANAGPLALEANARRVLGVRSSEGFIPADAVVNAAGAWAGRLDGVPAHARVPVAPVKGQMLALAMPRGFVHRVVWVPGAYLVPRDDGRLLVGASVEHAGFDVRVTAGAQRELLDAALRAAPALAELAVVESWAGLRPGTPDGLPYLGATALGGYFVAAGHFRNGILLVPETARVLADAVEGRPAETELRPFSPARANGHLAVAPKEAS